MNSLIKFGKIKISLRTFKFSDKIIKNELKDELRKSKEILKNNPDETEFLNFLRDYSHDKYSSLSLKHALYYIKEV